MTDYSQVIKGFIEAVAQKKGIDINDAAAFEQFSKELMERVNLTVLDQMPSDKMDEFADILATDDDVKISDFIKNNVPDLSGVVQNAISTF